MFWDYDITAAHQLFYFNTLAYPKSWHAYYELDSAYNKKGNPELAKATLLKVQKLNPDNEKIRKLMNTLPHTMRKNTFRIF